MTLNGNINGYRTFAVADVRSVGLPGVEPWCSLELGRIMRMFKIAHSGRYIGEAGSDTGEVESSVVYGLGS